MQKNIIRPLHVIAGFVDFCINQKRAVPFFAGDLKKYYKFFYDEISQNPDLFGNAVFDLDEGYFYFDRYVRECLELPKSGFITDFGKPHYQASIYLRKFLGSIDIFSRAKALEIGRDFYDEFVCDELGRRRRLTRLRKGEEKELF